MLKDVWAKFKGSVSTGLVWLGVLYAYPDIVGLPKEYGVERSDMPERETVLLVLLVVASFYIIWIDVRPYARRWRAATRPRVFSVMSPMHIAKDAIHYSEVGGSEFVAELRVPLFVQNQSDETLRCVRARMLTADGLIDLPTFGSDSTETDIHPGMSALFLAGTTLLPEGKMAGRPREFIELGAKSFNTKKLVARHPHFYFGGNPKYGFGGRTSESSPFSVFGGAIWISAENAAPLILSVQIVPDERTNPLRVIGLYDRQNRKLEPSEADTLDQPHSDSDKN